MLVCQSAAIQFVRDLRDKLLTELALAQVKTNYAVLRSTLANDEKQRAFTLMIEEVSSLINLVTSKPRDLQTAFKHGLTTSRV